jgi:single-stranded DNA-specific DHH superfamily exonuclease
MKDMQCSGFRIQSAINNNENILIFGDYDVMAQQQLPSCIGF